MPLCRVDSEPLSAIGIMQSGLLMQHLRAVFLRKRVFFVTTALYPYGPSIIFKHIASVTDLDVIATEKQR